MVSIMALAMRFFASVSTPALASASSPRCVVRISPPSTAASAAGSTCPARCACSTSWRQLSNSVSYAERDRVAMAVVVPCQFCCGLRQQASAPVGAALRHRQPVSDAVQRLVLRAFEQRGGTLVGACAVLLEYSLEQGLLVAERAVEAALAEPRDARQIATEAVAYLAWDRAQWITGASLIVDGGELPGIYPLGPAVRPT